MGKRKLEEVDAGDDSSQIESDDSCSSSNSITTNSSTDVPSGLYLLNIIVQIKMFFLAQICLKYC